MVLCATEHREQEPGQDGQALVMVLGKPAEYVDICAETDYKIGVTRIKAESDEMQE